MLQRVRHRPRKARVREVRRGRRARIHVRARHRRPLDVAVGIVPVRRRQSQVGGALGTPALSAAFPTPRRHNRVDVPIWSAPLWAGAYYPIRDLSSRGTNRSSSEFSARPSVRCASADAQGLPLARYRSLSHHTASAVPRTARQQRRRTRTHQNSAYIPVRSRRTPPIRPRQRTRSHLLHSPARAAVGVPHRQVRASST